MFSYKFIGFYLLFLAVAIPTGLQVAASKEFTDNYQLIAYLDCKVVHTAKLDLEQIEAYRRLNVESRQMNQLEIPIKKIQSTLNLLQQQLQQTASYDVKNSENLNPEMLSEQQDIADQLESLISNHQADFDALERQGEKIQSAADRFEEILGKSMPKVEFDHIQISDGSKKELRCHNEEVKM